MKVKVKMPLSYYVSIYAFIRHLTDNGYQAIGKDPITEQVLSQSLKELNEIIYKTIFPYTEYPAYQKKMISKSFPASYGLNFFGLFYGSNIDGYCKVPVKDMCRQLEQQLFISGPFELPGYVSTSQN